MIWCKNMSKNHGWDFCTNPVFYAWLLRLQHEPHKSFTTPDAELPGKDHSFWLLDQLRAWVQIMKSYLLHLLILKTEGLEGGSPVFNSSAFSYRPSIKDVPDSEVGKDFQFCFWQNPSGSIVLKLREEEQLDYWKKECARGSVDFFGRTLSIQSQNGAYEMAFRNEDLRSRMVDT